MTYPVIGDIYFFFDATGLKTKVMDALDHSTEYFFDYTKHQLTRTLDALGKELNYYYDAAGRVTKAGAGCSGDIMPTLNYYNGTTGMMTKVRYTDAASATSDVQYYFNKARQMTKLTDWTDDLEYRYPPAADRRHSRNLLLRSTKAIVSRISIRVQVKRRVLIKTFVICRKR